MSETPKINCPACGIPMNHHSDKLVYSGSSNGNSGSALEGGEIIEFHTCPSCGSSDTRSS
jgi:ribosomal protein S27AE